MRRTRRARSALTVLCTSLVLVTSAPADDLFDPVTGYRVDRYRAAVPEIAPGAQTVDVEGVAMLAAEGALLVDVGPKATLDADGRRWLGVLPHSTIKGAHWLPEVGRGTIQPLVADYLAETLMRLTDGETTRAIVVFCKVDCWMSWNAAKRIASLGYSAVYWFPGGIDAWDFEDRATETVAPEPFVPAK